jgi:beta-glucosidase
MKHAFLFGLLLFACLAGTAQKQPTGHKTIEQRIDSVLRFMTLEEKAGQMNQYSNPWSATGPIKGNEDVMAQIKAGKVGSMLNVTGAKRTRELQELAMQARLKIPLLFGQDVIHGYRTMFPIPLAEAASWDMEAIKKSARIAATEMSATGVHWTFAPMVDISRDPRWGRVMEGAGEDPHLGSLIATARVKGFQGDGPGNVNAVMACAKHFAAYGAAVGGRDYNTVEMSLSTLYNIYLPPFKAAADAGVATFMNSFNDLNGIPATGNTFLQRDILKRQWNFSGFVVSDWGSVGEMVNHGYAANLKEAALLAANAGSDMDMESRGYIQYLPQLVKEARPDDPVGRGKVKMNVVDDAVRRILRKKFELGLFENPYKFCSEEREKQQWNHKENLDAALDMARKSIVLLKNDRYPKQDSFPLPVLPLDAELDSGKMHSLYGLMYHARDSRALQIGLIGPLVKSVKEHLGFWSYDWDDDTTRIGSLYEAVKKRTDKDASLQLLYAKGCELTDTSKAGFTEAIETAKRSDIVVMYVGEGRTMTGEAKSKSDIHLPGVQEELIKAVYATGKPVVVIIGAGRPLIFNWTADNIPAILYTWWLGTKGPEAIAGVLFGDYNPSGKLPMSFPRSEGQIPVYYNHFNTGRPAAHDSDVNYVSAYIDLPNSPKFPFGFGLSYSRFTYSNFHLSKNEMKGTGEVKAMVTVKNTGAREGEETVQLYIRDVSGSIVRPVKELKGFQKIQLQAGESKTVSFIITTNELKFYNEQLKYDWEPGEFHIMIGGDSGTLLKQTLWWKR